MAQQYGSAYLRRKIWKFSLSPFQSCAGPQTVTNLIPSSIIQRPFCSDNMNLCRGEAREGELTDDWAKDGVEERMMDGACVCVWFFRFLSNLTFFFLLKDKLLLYVFHASTIMICGTLAHTNKYWRYLFHPWGAHQLTWGGVLGWSSSDR